VHAATLRRAHAGHPDDRVAIADQRDGGALPRGDCGVDEEILELLAAREPERLKTLSGQGAAHDERRPDPVQIERHTKRVCAEAPRVEARRAIAGIRAQRGASRQGEPPRDGQRPAPQGWRPTGGRGRPDAQAGAVAVGGHAAGQIPAPGAASRGEQGLDVAAAEIRGTLRDRPQCGQEHA